MTADVVLGCMLVLVILVGAASVVVAVAGELIADRHRREALRFERTRRRRRHSGRKA